MTEVPTIHLQQNGSKVSAGSVVNKGDVIGLGGNTGFSSRLHLHFFSFLLLDIEKVQTVRTKFRIDDGRKSEYLQEKRRYIKRY